MIRNPADNLNPVIPRMGKQILISLKILALMILLTGVLYPAFITVIAHLLFREKALGSIIRADDVVIGSELIGHNFDSSTYFSSRPSATGSNTLPSAGSNLCLTNDRLKQQVAEREQYFLRYNGLGTGTEVPAEMLFSSASGLDPHISPEAAFLQVGRIAKERNFSAGQKETLQKLITQLSEESQFRILGQKRINVFVLNLELDKIH
jgi:K+-transporting ATPase ATPase C chain